MRKIQHICGNTETHREDMMLLGLINSSLNHNTLRDMTSTHYRNKPINPAILFQTASWAVTVGFLGSFL